ncbi:MAG: class I SAM-dependent methyltransferase [Candidatus Aminicenantes bacterium]|nr:class I SAM-dependent methyltransferase [Candidatus Aminicenantes bacterium]
MRLCYKIAPPRVKRYLEAEIKFVLDRIKPSDLVLELGCGYGRVLKKMVPKAKTVVGIDTSYDSLRLTQKTINSTSSCHIIEMNAIELGFSDQQFDVVFCIQNGISAFKVDQRKLIEESMRVTYPGGTVLFSSYSERFWEDRLEWFRLQSKHALIGEIDEDATGDGTIVCKDGFRASTVSPDDFVSLIQGLDIDPIITEVDYSSIFYEIRIK